MKWIALALKRPDYNTLVFLYNEKTGEYSHGKLIQMTETGQGRIHRFDIGRDTAGEVQESDEFTHFAIPEPPKK